MKNSTKDNLKNKEEEIQAWLDQVHFGSCCSDENEYDCDDKKEKKEPSSKKGSTD